MAVCALGQRLRQRLVHGPAVPSSADAVAVGAVSEMAVHTVICEEHAYFERADLGPEDQLKRKRTCSKMKLEMDKRNHNIFSLVYEVFGW